MQDDFGVGYAVGRDSNNCYNNSCGMFGGNWIWIILLFALFGWGRNGSWGGRGDGDQLAYDLGKVATTNDVASGFNNSAVLSSLNDLKLGQSGLQQTMCQGFNGINTAVMQNGYETRSAINDLGYRMQDCCCQTQRAIDGVNYNMAKSTSEIGNMICNSTRDIIDSQREGTATIINYLTHQEIDKLRTENQTLRFQASQTAQNAFIAANQDAQTAELIRRLGRDCPVPAYVVPNPNCCYTPTGFNVGCGNGCGTNCCG